MAGENIKIINLTTTDNLEEIQLDPTPKPADLVVSKIHYTGIYREVVIVLYPRKGEPLTAESKWYIPPESGIALKNKYGFESIHEYVTIPYAFKPDAADVFFADVLVVSHNNVTLGRTPNTTNSLTKIASLVITIPGMVEAFDAYMANPDPHVTIIPVGGKDQSEVTRVDMENQQFSPGTGKWTRGESIGIAYIALLYLTKTPVTEEQHEQVIKKRIGAIGSALGDATIKDSWKKVKQVLTKSFCEGLSDYAQSYPRFKQAVYRTIINGTSPMHVHIKTILSNSQLTAFNLAGQFLRAPRKTLAHVNQRCIKEAIAWLRAESELQVTYGRELVPYCKLIDPTEQRAAVTDMKYLVSAAIVYFAYHESQTSMLYLKTKKLAGATVAREAVALLKEEFQPVGYGNLGLTPTDIQLLSKAYGFTVDLTLEYRDGATEPQERTYRDLLREMRDA